MSRQRESKWLADPMSDYLRYKGWHIETLVMGSMMEGLPDKIAWHIKYPMPRFIEFKIRVGNSISFTKPQIQKFPLMIAHGAQIWILVSDRDISGEMGYPMRESLYQKLLQPANGQHMVSRAYHLLF